MIARVWPFLLGHRFASQPGFARRAGPPSVAQIATGRQSLLANTANTETIGLRLCSAPACGSFLPLPRYDSRDNEETVRPKR